MGETQSIIHQEVKSLSSCDPTNQTSCVLPKPRGEIGTGQAFPFQKEGTEKKDEGTGPKQAQNLGRKNSMRS